MAEESFKERARQEMIKAAKQYKDIYVDYEYLICSVTFEKNAESLYLCGVSAFVLSNGFSLALFENGVMIGKIERTGIRRRLPCNMPESYEKVTR